MLIRILKMFTDATDFVEPWIFARRAPKDGKMEESASHHVRVILTSSDSLLLAISDATSEFEATDVKL